MKILYTAILFGLVLSTRAQDFSTTPETAKTYPASYFSSTTDAVITADYQLLHANAELDILDLKSGKTVYTWSPDGRYGEIWVSVDGKFVGRHSKNAKDPSGAYKDALHVLDVSTKKVYTRFTPQGYWNNGAFSSVSSEMVINEYDSEKGTASIILYDFVRDEIVKTLFTTSKFSTVVMDLAYSKDGSKIYAGIAPNSSTTYVNVYDAKSYSLLKKISLSYQMDQFFISEDNIFVSGAEGDSGDPHTSKYSAKDYSKKAEWDFRINNIDPTGSYSLLKEYKSDMMVRVDLETGKKTDFLNVSSLRNIYSVSGFSPDSKYFFSAVQREGEMKYQGGSVALIVFKNSLIEDNHPITVPYLVDKPIIEDVPAWITHSTANPKFDLDFPATPKITEGTTSKGRFKLSLKQSATDYVYMLHLVELSKKVKESKYEKVAENMADTFVEKIGPEESRKSEFTCNGQMGTEYTFTIGKIFYRYRAICIYGIAYQIIYLNSSEDGDAGDAYYASFKPEQ